MINNKSDIKNPTKQIKILFLFNFKFSRFLYKKIPIRTETPGKIVIKYLGYPKAGLGTIKKNINIDKT